MIVLIAIGGAVFTLGCLIALFRVYSRKRIIDDTPTSKAQGVFIGMTELKGTAESEAPLVSYLSGIRTVHYSWHVSEHWQRIVTETYTDAQGRSHTRTRTESGWKQVANGDGSQPFYLKDDTSMVRVVPERASITGIETFNETVNRDDPLYFGKGPLQEVANSTHRRRFEETAVPLHAALYVMGQARQREDVVAAEIAADKAAPMFIISMKTERQVSTGYGRWAWFWGIFGLLLAVGTAVAAGAVSNSFVAVPPVIAGVAYLGALAIGWVWTVYNGLVNLHHRVEQAWSQVDVQLKRRNDLIPNLVEAVAGYRDYESGTQQLVTELRGQMAATPPGVSGPDFKGMAPGLRVVIERYPDLKTSESFLRLQNSLVDTEQRIALARDYFNETATFFNTRLAIIPERFVAALARFRPRALMSAADFERAPVRVVLAS